MQFSSFWTTSRSTLKTFRRTFVRCNFSCVDHAQQSSGFPKTHVLFLRFLTSSGVSDVHKGISLENSIYSRDVHKGISLENSIYSRDVHKGIPLENSIYSRVKHKRIPLENFTSIPSTTAFQFGNSDYKRAQHNRLPIREFNPLATCKAHSRSCLDFLTLGVSGHHIEEIGCKLREDLRGRHIMDIGRKLHEVVPDFLIKSLIVSKLLYEFF